MAGLSVGEIRLGEVCLCGRQHTVVTEVLVAARSELPGLLGKVAAPGSTVLVTGDPITYALAGEEISGILADAGWRAREGLIESRHPHTDEKTIAGMIAAVPPDCAALIAVGSGTVTDVTRMTAFRTGRPFLSVPTAASMDGYTSPVVPIFTGRIKQAAPAAPPAAVLVDLDLVATAPLHMIKAGFGDLAGKLTARGDWVLAMNLTGEYFCPTLAALSTAALDKAQADLPGLANKDRPALGALMEGLLFAGLAMQMADSSRPASGAEHHLGHYWEERTLLAGTRGELHGTYVGVATPIAAAVTRRLMELEVGEIAALLDRSAGANHEPDLSLEEWEKTRRALMELVPEPEVIRSILSAAGAPSRPREIGLTAVDVRAALLHAHEGRPRFTALTLAHRLGVMTDWTDRIVAEAL